MKTLHRVLPIVLTSFFFLITSCQSDSLTGTMTSMTLPPVTSTLVATLSSPTSSPSSTSTPTVTISLTAGLTATPTTTLTPTVIPTLPLEEAEVIISDLLQNNGGCELPCWWGVIPGQASWKELKPFLQSLSLEIYRPGDEQTTRSQQKFYEVYVRRDLMPTTPFWSLYEVRNGIIEGIEIASIKPQYFPLSQLLTVYGRPDEVWLVTYANTPDGSHPFRMTLVYSERGFVVSYELEDIAERENKLVACLAQPDRISLWLVSPERKITFADARVSTLQVSEEENYRTLAEATDLTIETFYEIFGSSDNTHCLETPGTLWDYP